VTEHLRLRKEHPTDMSHRRPRPAGARGIGLVAVVGLGLLGLFLLSSGSPSWATERQSRLHQTLPTAEPLPTPVTVPVSLAVTLQRPNSPPPSLPWAVPVQLAIYLPGDSIIWDEWYLVLDQSGKWSGMLTLVPGLYDVRIKNLHTLRNVRRNVNIVGPTALNMGELHEGDADNDNRVRITDFALLRNAYFTNKGDAKFDPRADFDEDRRIRITDFALLRANYFQNGDIEVGAAAAMVQSLAQERAYLRLDPTVATLQVGSTLEVTVTATSGAQDIVGAEFELSFDPTVLQVVDTKGQPATQVLAAGPMPPILNTVDVANGSVRYGAGTFGVARGSVPLAVVRLQALASASSTTLLLSQANIVTPQGKSLMKSAYGAGVDIESQPVVYYLPLLSMPKDARR